MNNSSVLKFLNLSGQERFQGWPLVGQPVLGEKIPFFGQTLHYQLQTPTGVQDYTSILRYLGWAVTFGIVDDYEGKGPHVITLCQWKPGVNQASWELPPGGIGKISQWATAAEILLATQTHFLKETGYANDAGWTSLGHVVIESGKYRGADQNGHGLPAHLFLAQGLVKVDDARKPNPEEIIETFMVPLGEVPEVVNSGYFNEASAVACALKALAVLAARP